MIVAYFAQQMRSHKETKGLFPFRMCVIYTTVWLIAHMATASAAPASDPEHFTSGEFNGTLSWDSISAVESGIYRFGGSAAWFVLDGVAVGYEQQFVMPRGEQLESRSWGFVRLVPFRDWPLAPFLALRLGYYYLPDTGAAAAGFGCGFTVFLSKHVAFEASFRTQLVFHPQTEMEHQQEVDTHFALYF